MSCFKGAKKLRKLYDISITFFVKKFVVVVVVSLFKIFLKLLYNCQFKKDFSMKIIGKIKKDHTNEINEEF